jgi:ATP-binding cassette, subfamily B, bacterial PglK
MVAVNSSVFKFAEIKRVLLLLEKKDRLKLFLVLIVNTFLAFLDLFGVALIGITSAILIRGLQGLTAGDQVSRFLELLKIDGLPQRNLLILLGGTAIFFFIMKTILSVYFLRRTLRYMSIRNAQISSSLVSKMLNRPVEKIFSNLFSTKSITLLVE